MPFVLTTGSSIVCGHGGSATLSSSAKLTIDGEPVLLENEASAWIFDPGCSQKNADKSELQCAVIERLTAGVSDKLSVGGIAVVTGELGGETSGKPKFSDLAGTAGQSKLEVSS